MVMGMGTVFLSKLVSPPDINPEQHLPAESQPPNSQPSSDQATDMESQLPETIQATDMESQLPETIQPELSFTANLQTQQPQLRHSFTANHQPANTENAVNRRPLLARMLMLFCFAAASQSDHKYGHIDQHVKPYLKYLRGACIALPFFSIVLSLLIHDKFALASRRLENAGISLGVASFFYHPRTSIDDMRQLKYAL